MNKSALLICLFLFPFLLNAQVSSFSINTGLGYGFIKGNSPEFSSLQTKISISTQFKFAKPLFFSISYSFSEKYERFIPGEEKNRYFPKMQSIGIWSTLSNKLSKKIFVSGSIGLISINDKTYSDINVWSTGTAFNTSLNLDLRKKQTGFTLGILIEYGITFNNTTPSYKSIQLTLSYYLL